VRRIDICVVCGDPRVEIVSRGRCAKCLMAERREALGRGEPVHNPQEYSMLRELNRYHTRLLKAITALEDGAIPDTYISTADHLTMRRILREGIDQIQLDKKEAEEQAAARPKLTLTQPKVNR
jgi:hypothetical protein